MEQIKEKVIEHDFAINSMAKSIADLAETTKDSNVKLGDIARSMGKQELILEKLANLEVNSKDSINRLHKRVDEAEEHIKNVEKRGDKSGCTVVREANSKIDVLNRTVYGKDGRGGLIFDVEDIKKFMYKSMGAFTLINILLGAVIAFIAK